MLLPTILLCKSSKQEVKPWGCPEYHQSYNTKAVIHHFTISQDSVLMQISLSIEVADRVKKRCISVKEINISKSIRHHGYGSYFKTIMIKCAEQTNKCYMTRKYYITRSKRLKVKTTQTRTCQFCVKIGFCIDSETGLSVSFNTI
jgi:hypothetical protein